ncbi:MAG: hypothetical protein NVSMB27_48280 [Ktedonobacteraceae bacterium]
MTERYHQRGGRRIVPDYLCQSKSIAQGRIAGVCYNDRGSCLFPPEESQKLSTETN